MPRSSKLHIRVSQHEHDLWMGLAAEHHISLSEYIRGAILMRQVEEYRRREGGKKQIVEFTTGSNPAVTEMSHERD